MRWLILALVIFAALAILRARALRRRRWAAEENAFAAAHAGFETFVSPQDRSVIAVRPETRELDLGTMRGWRRYSFDDIVSVEVLRDSEVIAKADGALPPGAAPVGIPLAPPTPGRRAAGLHSLEIEIAVYDGAAPVRVVTFLRGAGGGDVRGRRMKAAVESAERFERLLFDAMAKRRPLSDQPHAASPAFAKLREISEGDFRGRAPA